MNFIVARAPPAVARFLQELDVDGAGLRGGRENVRRIGAREVEGPPGGVHELLHNRVAARLVLRVAVAAVHLHHLKYALGKKCRQKDYTTAYIRDK